MALRTLYKPTGDYTDAEVAAIRQAAMRSGNYSTVASGDLSGRTIGATSGWEKPAADDYIYQKKFNEQRPDLFNSNRTKHGLTDVFSKVVEYGVQAVVVGGIAYGGSLAVAQAAAGGSAAAAQSAAAASDAGFLPPPVSGAPVTPTLTAATVPAGGGAATLVGTVKTLGVLAGTTTAIAAAANSFKGTKDVPASTDATVPTTRSSVRPYAGMPRADYLAANGVPGGNTATQPVAPWVWIVVAGLAGLLIA